MTAFRVGHGFDVHQLAVGRALIVGGVKIDFDRGLLGHSDADVLLHAICDALLGAAGMGDIGNHFPDSDARFKAIDSRELLRIVAAKITAAGFTVGNVDATIIAQVRRMAPHIAAMVANIAADLGTGASQVNVKATTTEKLGFTGRGEGYRCGGGVRAEQGIDDAGGHRVWYSGPRCANSGNGGIPA